MAPLRQSHAPTPMTPAAPTGRWVSDLWQDLRYASRMFRKQPGFAATAVLTLALGIGATTAIFSVVYGVLLKPLPFHEPDRLVSLLHTVPDGGRNHGPATYFTYRDNQRAFETVGAWESNDVTITGRGEPEHALVLSVSDGTLPLLRVQPVVGRLFNADDDSPGSPLRAVLTYGYWQRRFGGDDGVIGQSLDIDGAPAEIIGVLPASFKFLRETPALLLPMQLDRADADHIEFDFQVLARLKPGVDLAQANADVARMIPLLPQMFAKLELQPNVRPLADDVIGDVGRSALDPPGGRRRGAAHRLRERREPVPDPRRGAPAGAGDAGRARRQPRPYCARAADRERAAGAGGRRTWRGVRAGRHWPAAADRAGAAAARRRHRHRR